MKFLNAIKAFFTFKGEEREIEVSSAQISKKGVFLHPAEQPDQVIFMKSESVDILINPGKEIDEDDIKIIDKKQAEKIVTATDTKSRDNDDVTYGDIRPSSLNSFMPAKKRFSVLLYPDEYDMLTKTIKENGYKKAEYFLACMTSVKKQSMDANYKKYFLEHKARHKNELIEAKKAQEEDYRTRLQLGATEEIETADVIQE